MIREEEKALADRRRAKENEVNNKKNYLSNYLLSKGIKKLDTPRAALAFRSSKAVSIGDENALIDYLKANYVDLVKVAESVDKTGLKSLIESGHEIPNAVIEERQNIQIK
jgi:protein tyrosine/serine phosphatase